MDAFSTELLAKLPLAEAFHLTLAHVVESQFLNDLYEQHRGGNYTKCISFSVLTHLIGDALIQGRSGTPVFQNARDDGRLNATVDAAFKKLGRMPAAVSMALTRACCQRTKELFPGVSGQGESTLPAAFAGYDVIVLDGKVSKGVQRRLKALRGAKGGLIGGRSLVAYSLTEALVLACHSEEDGDANDVRFLPDMMQQVRPLTSAPRIWVCDAQFCRLKPFKVLTAVEQDKFAIRFSKAMRFIADEQKPVRTGVDRDGRTYTDHWGHIGVKNENRHYVRYISVDRGSGESFGVVTNLLDEEAYPAADVLELYRLRPDIETVFQRLTEVLRLRELIGNSPLATLFQLAVCFVCYNILQLLRSYIAQSQDKKLDEISPKKLLEDVRDQILASHVILGRTQVISIFDPPLPAEQLRQRLAKLLNCWTPRWAKAKRRRHRPAKAKNRTTGHASAYKIIHKVKSKSRK